MTTPETTTPTRDPCPEIPGELRTWNGFDAFLNELRTVWPEADSKMMSFDPLIFDYRLPPAGLMVGYVQRDRTVKDDRWRRFGVSGKIRARKEHQ